METDPDRWIAAVRHSHDALRALAGPLTAEQLRQRSYDSEWSIAQVLSHLGSQAEVFGLWLEAGLTGQEPPGQEVFGPIWEAWNTRSPQAQAADSLQANEALVERLESLDDGQRERFRLLLFGMDLDIAGLARMRLSEHAVHSWDVAVALDPSARVAPEAVGLLIDTLGQLAGGPASRMGTSGRCTCRRATRSGTSRWRPARRSRSNPPRPESATRTARSCGCPPRLSSGWSTGVSILPTPRPSRPGGSISTSSGQSSPASEARARDERTSHASSCQGA